MATNIFVILRIYTIKVFNKYKFNYNTFINSINTDFHWITIDLATVDFIYKSI